MAKKSFVNRMSESGQKVVIKLSEDDYKVVIKLSEGCLKSDFEWDFVF